MSKEKTTEEIRDEFLDNIRNLANYWSKNGGDVKDKLDGLAFSILVLLDGCSSMPGFILAPDPCPEDKQYHIDNNNDYYPENLEAKVNGDISGLLHDNWYKK